MLLDLSIYSNDFLGRMLSEQLTKRGILHTVAEYQSYQDPPEDTIVIRSPLSNGWGLNAPKQITIEYDLDLVQDRVQRAERGESVNQQYAYRMVKEACNKLVRKYVQQRLSRRERKQLGLPVREDIPELRTLAGQHG